MTLRETVDALMFAHLKGDKVGVELAILQLDKMTSDDRPAPVDFSKMVENLILTPLPPKE